MTLRRIPPLAVVYGPRQGKACVCGGMIWRDKCAHNQQYELKVTCGWGCPERARKKREQKEKERAAKKAHELERRRAARAVQKLKKTCVACGEVFRPKLRTDGKGYDISNFNKTKYCSRRCAKKSGAAVKAVVHGVLLSEHDLARVAGVSLSTIRRRVKRGGDLLAPRPPGGPRTKP